MIKRLIWIPAAAILCASCGGTKVAEKYAARMAETLTTYRDQVDAKIKAEQQSYLDLAKIYDTANAERVRNGLLLERNKRATELTDRLVRERAASPNRKVAWISQVHSDIERFADLDFQQSQEVFTRELEAYKKSIQGLADLTVEQGNLDKLKDALEALAQPKSIVEKLKAGAEFGCEVNRTNQLVNTTAQIDALAKKITAETDAAKKKSLEKQKKDLDAQKTKLEKPCKVG